MKRFVLFLVMMQSLVAYAQFSPKIQIYYDFGVVDRYKNKFYGAYFIGDYSLNDHFKTGIGVGLCDADLVYYEHRFYDDNIRSRTHTTLLPIFVDFQYKVLKEGISPYINFDGGYSLSSSSKSADTGGMFLLPALGVSFPLGRNELLLQVGYRFQTYEYETESTGYNYPTQEKKEKTGCSAIELSVGFTL